MSFETAVSGVTAPDVMTLGALSLEAGYQHARVDAFIRGNEGASIEEASVAHARLFALLLELARRAESAS